MKKTEFEKSTTFNLNESVDYSKDSIVSKTILNKPTGTLTLFAFDEGQSFSEHTAPFDALIQVIEGNVLITIDKKEFNLSAGEIIIMPANIPHAVFAKKRFKMLLSMMNMFFVVLSQKILY